MSSTFIAYLLVTLVVSTQASIPKNIPFQVLAQHSHKQEHFTQGLLFKSPYLYESIGLYAQSKLIRYSWPELEYQRSIELPKTLFAEGIALVDDKLIQLTWRENKALVYNTSNLKPQTSHSFHGEGWGLTSDGQHYIMSSGNHCLQYRDKDFSLLKTLCLKDPKYKKWRLNDLSYQGGYVYANILFKDIIAKIEPNKAEVVGIINLSSIRAKLPKSAQVLNGITHLDAHTMLITGKLWPYFYTVQLYET